MVNNVVVKDESSSETVKVTIGHTLVEEILNKKLDKTTITPFQAPNNQDIETGAESTLVLDLNGVMHRYHVKGLITDGLGTASPEQSTAILKKNDLKKLFKKGGRVFLEYESVTNIQVFWEQLLISDIPRDTIAGSATPDTFDVDFSVILAEPMGGT